MMQRGETKSMDYGQALMVIGEALKSGAPYSSKALAGKENESVDWWADFAHMCVENKLWTEDILSNILSYSVSSIPMTIDIQDDSTIMVLGGVDGKTEQGRKLIADIHQKMAEGRVSWRDQNGNDITPKDREKEERKKKRKAQKQARRRSR